MSTLLTDVSSDQRKFSHNRSDQVFKALEILQPKISKYQLSECKIHFWKLPIYIWL